MGQAIDYSSHLPPYDQLLFNSSGHVSELLDLLAQEMELLIGVKDKPPNENENAFFKLKKNSFQNEKTSASLSVVVFVTRRQTAVALANLIGEAALLNPRLSWIKVGFAVGSTQAPWMHNKNIKPTQVRR